MIKGPDGFTTEFFLTGIRHFLLRSLNLGSGVRKSTITQKHMLSIIS